PPRPPAPATPAPPAKGSAIHAAEAPAELASAKTAAHTTALAALAARRSTLDRINDVLKMPGVNAFHREKLDDFRVVASRVVELFHQNINILEQRVGAGDDHRIRLIIVGHGQGRTTRIAVGVERRLGLATAAERPESRLGRDRVRIDGVGVNVANDVGYVDRLGEF